MPQPPSGDRGAQVRRLQDLFLVDRVNGAFRGAEEPGPHLDPAGPQQKGGRHTAPVGDAAGGQHGQLCGVADLGDQYHSGQFSHMAAALSALGDEGGCPQPGHALCHGDGGHHGDHPDPGGGPVPQIAGGVSRSGGDHGNGFLRHHLCHFARKGAHEQEIDPDGTVCQGPGQTDLLPDPFP